MELRYLFFPFLSFLLLFSCSSSDGPKGDYHGGDTYQDTENGRGGRGGRSDTNTPQRNTNHHNQGKSRLINTNEGPRITTIPSSSLKQEQREKIIQALERIKENNEGSQVGELAERLIGSLPKDLNQKVGQPKETLLNLMIRVQELEAFNALLDAGVNVTIPDENGNPPLFAAASMDNKEFLERLLSKGVDINQINTNTGNNVIHYLLQLDVDEKQIELLIEKGANLNLKNKIGYTPLIQSITQKKINQAKFLITKEADLQVNDNKDASPLHWAAFYGLEEVVDLLMAKGAKVNIQTGTGFKRWTPLHDAASAGSATIIKKFLDVHPEIIDLQSDVGNTALHMAVKKERIEAVEMLLLYNPNLTITNVNGRTPLQVAENNNFTDIANVLRTAMSN